MPASVEGFIAVNRFGLGAKPGELETASADPRGWLKEQLAGAPVISEGLQALPASQEILAELDQLRAARKFSKASANGRPGKGVDGNSPTLTDPGDANAAGAARDKLFADLGQRGRDLYLKEVTARTLAQVEATQPLRERLVVFWSNHFTVSIVRPLVLGLAGAFEREAIRPNVTGRFHDLLLAAVRHPAMLLYLDNAQSTGPNSRLGIKQGKGLNENLARELLELHTLGVDGGYTQADVTSFARILTGWSIAGLRDRDPGTFKFRAYLHEPGEKMFMAERFGPAGEQEGLQALDFLARHPSTARHIARQLTIHFIADDPPPATVERLASVFRDSDGDLLALTEAIIDSPEAWEKPLGKLKTPNELVVSTLRAVGYSGDDKRLMGSLRGLGQPPFAAPSPAGWPDTAAAWAGPSAILQRADYAAAVAKRLAGRTNPARLLTDTVAPVADQRLNDAVARAATMDDANGLILASPQFQRR